MKQEKMGDVFCLFNILNTSLDYKTFGFLRTWEELYKYIQYLHDIFTKHHV